MSSPARVYCETDARAAEGAAAAGARAEAAGGGGGGGGEAFGLSAVPPTVRERFVLCPGGQRRSALLTALSEMGVSRRKGGGGIVQGGGGEGEEGGGRKGGGSGRRGEQPRVMVFVAEIKSIRALASCLKRHGMRAGSLHGSLEQARALCRRRLPGAAARDAWGGVSSVGRARAGAARLPRGHRTSAAQRGLAPFKEDQHRVNIE